MATKSIQSVQQQLEAAQERVKQLKAKQQALKARERAKEAKERRTRETRQKILIGAYIQKHHTDDEIRKMLDTFLEEDRDRELFGMKPKLNHIRDSGNTNVINTSQATSTKT